MKASMALAVSTGVIGKAQELLRLGEDVEIRLKMLASKTEKKDGKGNYRTGPYPAPSACELMWAGKTSTTLTEAHKKDDPNSFQDRFSSLTEALPKIFTSGRYAKILDEAREKLAELSDEEIGKWNGALDEAIETFQNAKLIKTQAAA